jgi:hypothetical protein
MTAVARPMPLAAPVTMAMGRGSGTAVNLLLCCSVVLLLSQHNARPSGDR